MQLSTMYAMFTVGLYMLTYLDDVINSASQWAFQLNFVVSTHQNVANIISYFEYHPVLVTFVNII